MKLISFTPLDFHPVGRRDALWSLHEQVSFSCHRNSNTKDREHGIYQKMLGGKTTDKFEDEAEVGQPLWMPYTG
jgi:hypothetical protein